MRLFHGLVLGLELIHLLAPLRRTQGLILYTASPFFLCQGLRLQELFLEQAESSLVFLLGLPPIGLEPRDLRLGLGLGLGLGLELGLELGLGLGSNPNPNPNPNLHVTQQYSSGLPL